MKKRLGILFFGLMVAWSHMQIRAETTSFVKDGKFAFEIKNPEREIAELLPGDEKDSIFYLKNQTDDELWYAIADIQCDGNEQLLDSIRCSLIKKDSKILFSDTLSNLHKKFQNQSVSLEKIPLKAAEEQKLQLVLRLDHEADNRVMGQSCRVTVVFVGGSDDHRFSESESRSEGNTVVTEYHIHRYYGQNSSCESCRKGGPGVIQEVENMPYHIPDNADTEPGKAECVDTDSEKRKDSTELTNSGQSKEEAEVISVRVPKTGDVTDYAVLLILMGISLAAVIVLTVKLKERKDL